MPNKFYLPTGGAAPISPAFDTGWNINTNGDRISLSFSTGATALTSKTTAASASIGWNLQRQYVSPPMAAQTIAGFVSGQLRSNCSVAGGVLSTALTIKYFSNDGTVLRGTGLALKSGTSAFTTTLTNRFIPNSGNLTSVALSEGDRIVIEVGARQNAAVSSTYTENFGNNAATDLAIEQTGTAALNPWISFSQSLKFLSSGTINGVTRIISPNYVDYDATAPSSAATGLTGVTGLSWSHTCSGNNRLLTVGVAVGKAAGDAGLSLTATYAGQSMTSAGLIHGGNQTVGFVQLFYIVAPATGTNTVQVALAGGTADLVGGSVSFKNVYQTTPVRNIGTAQNTVGAPSISVASATGNMVVDVASNGSPITASTQLQRWLKNLASSEQGNAASSTAAGAPSVTMAYTTSNDWWGQVAMDIQRMPITANQVGVARIKKSITATQTGIARILVTKSNTQTGLSRIKNTITRTQIGLASVKNTVTRTQTGIARIKVTKTVTQTGVTSITAPTSVVFDAVGPDSTGAVRASGAGNTLSWQHVCTSGANRLLVVVVANSSITAAASSVTSVTYNGTSMTSAGFRASNDQTAGGVHMFYLVNPDSGNNTVLVTVNTASDIEAGSVSFSNVNQNSPVRNFTSNVGDSTSPSLTISSATNNMVVDGTSSGGTFSASSQTQRWNRNQNQATAGGNGASSTAAGASSVNMGYTAVIDWWAVVGLDVVVAGGSGTSTKTQTGVTRILATKTQTQTGISRILVTRTNTQTGVARVKVSIPNTQTGLARVKNTITATQTGVARILVTDTRTQAAVSRIKISVTGTQTGISRIKNTITPLQTGVARIFNTRSNTITGVARLQISTTKTQTGIARILKSSANTQIGVARILASRTNTIIGLSRIKNSITKLQTSLSRILRTFANTQTAVSRILASRPTNQFGVSRILNSRTNTQTGVSRVKNSITFTQLGVARVLNSRLNIQTGIARIQKSATANQTALARIQVRLTKTQLGVARIKNSVSATQLGRASIITLGAKLNTITGKAAILNSVTKTQSGVARILISNTKNQLGQTRISASRANLQTGIARIQVSKSQTQTGIARVQKSITSTQTGIARILASRVNIQTGVARIKISKIQPQTAVSRIQKSSINSINGVSRIRNTINQNIVGISRIFNSLRFTVSSVGRIFKSFGYPITGLSRIKTAPSAQITGLISIKNSVAKTITGTTNITTGVHHTGAITGVARIFNSGNHGITIVISPFNQNQSIKISTISNDETVKVGATSRNILIPSASGIDIIVKTSVID
jgi:hypothetical protein